jgi:hypothetical protein
MYDIYVYDISISIIKLLSNPLWSCRNVLVQMCHTHLNCYVLVLVALFLLYMSPSPSADVWCKHLSLSRALITLNSFTRPKHANQGGSCGGMGKSSAFFVKKGLHHVQIVNPAFFYNQSCTFGMRWWFKVFEQLFSCYTNINFLFASMKLLTNFENAYWKPSSKFPSLRFVDVLQRRSFIGCGENAPKFTCHKRLSVWFYIQDHGAASCMHFLSKNRSCRSLKDFQNYNM